MIRVTVTLRVRPGFSRRGKHRGVGARAFTIAGAASSSGPVSNSGA
jgi:hypothetical protein